MVQISRWDALKDPIGVIRGFAQHVAPVVPDAHRLRRAGGGVGDRRPGGRAGACPGDRRVRGAARRDRRAGASRGAADGRRPENAAIVNALQRRADVVVQKSLTEGFGLTVAEAMWKARPVVASRIGGIQDQIVDGETGILLDDPLDLAVYGAAVRSLLDDPPGAEAMGRDAKERVRRRFLGTRTLIQAIELYEQYISTQPQR